MEVFSVNQILRELSKNSQLALLLLTTTTNCSGYNKGSSGKRCSFAGGKGGNLRTLRKAAPPLQTSRCNSQQKLLIWNEDNEF